MPAAARDGVLTGMVYVPERIGAPAGSSVTVDLVDVTDLNRPKTLGEFSSDVAAFPVKFKLRFDPSAVREGHVYQARARLDVPGKAPWRHEQVYPVLTGGTPSYVEIRLTPGW